MRTFTKAERAELDAAIKKFVDIGGVNRVAIQLADAAFGVALHHHTEWEEHGQDADRFAAERAAIEHSILSDLPYTGMALDKETGGTYFKGCLDPIKQEYEHHNPRKGGKA